MEGLRQSLEELAARALKAAEEAIAKGDMAKARRLLKIVKRLRKLAHNTPP